MDFFHCAHYICHIRYILSYYLHHIRSKIHTALTRNIQNRKWRPRKARKVKCWTRDAKLVFYSFWRRFLKRHLSLYEAARGYKKETTTRLIIYFFSKCVYKHNVPARWLWFSFFLTVKLLDVRKHWVNWLYIAYCHSMMEWRLSVKSAFRQLWINKAKWFSFKIVPSFCNGESY